MTFEEMQKIIEDMLAVQRELQESQLALKESQLEIKENQRELQNSQREFLERQLSFERSQEAQKQVLDAMIQRYGDLAQQSIRQQEILDRLIGYSLTNESEHLDLEEKLQALEARIKRVEERN